MAKDNNLQDFLTDIADAIREKKGTTEKINPQDFAIEIANLSSGGSGSESGGSSNIYPTKYYKVLDSSVIDKNLLVWLSGCYINDLNIGSCTPSFVMENESYYQYITKISFNPVNDYNGVLCHSIEELVHNDENVLSKLESITEEQFYSLE